MSLKSFFKSIAGFSISSWSGFFVSIIAVSLTTRLFSPEITGGLNQFNNVSSLLVCFCALGFDNAFIRFYFESPNKMTVNELLFKCMLSSLIAMLVISSILIFFSASISIYLFQIQNNILLIYLCVNALSMMIIDRYFTLIYRMSNRSKEYTVCQILLNITSRLCVLIAAFSEPSLENVCLYNTLGVLFLTLIYVIIQRNEIKFESHFLCSNGYKIIARFAITSWPTNLLIRFNYFIVPFLIGVYLDNYNIGIYASGMFFCSAFMVFANGFNVYWSPFMYKHYKTHQDFIRNIHEYVVLFSIIAMSVILVIQNIAYLLIGEQYHASKIFFSMLLLEPMFTLIAGTTSYGISIVGKNEETVLIYILSVILNVVFTVLFIVEYGLVGVAFGLGLSSLIRLLMLTVRGQKYYVSIHSWKKTFTGLLVLFFISFANMLSYYNSLTGKLLLVYVYIVAFLNYKNEFVCIKKYIMTKE